MKIKTRNQPAAGCLRLVCSLILLAVMTAHAATNDTLPPVPANETNATELLRSNLQLQEQLHRVQLSIEANREQADAAAIRNAQSIANRLEALEQTLAKERTRDIDAVRSSTRVMWIVACTFGIVGILAMVLMAYQWRTVSRLAQASLPSGPMFGPGANALTPFGNDDRRLLSNGQVERSNAQLIGALELLEKRIKDLERTNSAAVQTTNPMPEARPALPLGSSMEASTENGSADTAKRSRISVLLGKGQSLLRLDQADNAMTCFEEALGMEPNHAEALLHKASALERLGKFPEAIEQYDRALAADSSLILAYLYKGGIFNRMERYEEALECYEQALRAQEKR
jgi:tetratricopeptide (TPR) repeat protein